jgi:hypothetical protein
MAHPYHHALSSARLWGGTADDYLPLHAWFDESKMLTADFRHRALRHHSEGIFMAERFFGPTITISTGRVVPLRLIGEQHVREDLGFIPSFADWARRIRPEPWMGRAQPIHRDLDPFAVTKASFAAKHAMTVHPPSAPAATDPSGTLVDADANPDSRHSATAAPGRMASPRPADGPQLPAVAAAAEESIAAVRLESRHAGAGRHFEPLEDPPGCRLDAPQIAFVAFPGGVPEFAVDPGDTRNEAIGFDGAEHGAGFRIDLMDLPAAVLADPECTFSPGQPRIPAIAGCRNGADYLAGAGIDLPDHSLGDLEQMRSVERRSCMRADIERADNFATFGVKGVHPVARGEPNPLPIKADAMHAADFGKRSVFTKDFGLCVFHGLILPDRHRGRE